MCSIDYLNVVFMSDQNSGQNEVASSVCFPDFWGYEGWLFSEGKGIYGYG